MEKDLILNSSNPRNPQKSKWSILANLKVFGNDEKLLGDYIKELVEENTTLKQKLKVAQEQLDTQGKDIAALASLIMRVESNLQAQITHIAEVK